MVQKMLRVNHALAVVKWKGESELPGFQGGTGGSGSQEPNKY